MAESFVLHGAVIYSRDLKNIAAFPSAWVVCDGGISKGVFETLPDEYRDLPQTDFGTKLIMPGLTDLHVHAPQYPCRGNGMDLELLDWLDQYIFPEESKYKDLSYAKKAYSLFAEEMRKGPTTRACVFSTIHPEATSVLMDLLEETGLRTYVGKVNMDRNSPDYYTETTEESAAATRSWLEAMKAAGYSRTRPIITPRFTPTCTRELMCALGELAKEYDIPVQSHLSENLSEISWVKELESDVSCYADSYEKAGIFGEHTPCVMAHCVWSDDEELSLIKKRGVFIAHSPESNINLSSGAAPVRRFLDMGLHVGLASDVSAGSTTSMFSAMRNAVYASKLRWRLMDQSLRPLTFQEVFYLATKGGGAFFGNVGSLEAGYEFDAVVLDDTPFLTSREDETVLHRTERAVYLADQRDVAAKYVAGRRVF